MNGSDWAWASVMMVFWVVVLGVVVWAVIRLAHRNPIGGAGSESALDELDRRLARGEIDVDEYKLRRDAMRPAAS